MVSKDGNGWKEARGEVKQQIIGLTEDVSCLFNLQKELTESLHNIRVDTLKEVNSLSEKFLVNLQTVQTNCSKDNVRIREELSGLKAKVLILGASMAAFVELVLYITKYIGGNS